MNIRNHFALLLVATICLCQYQTVCGYDLIQTMPIPRGGRWRHNASALPDFHDDQMNCGGYSVNTFFIISIQISAKSVNFPKQIQWVKNNGACGPCGDDFSLPQPRPHESQGIFSDIGFRTIFRQFSTAQFNIFIPSVYLNADISFDLCQLPDNGQGIETEACFAKHKLHYSTPNGVVASVGPQNTHSMYTFYVTLPFHKMNRAVLRMSATTGT